MQKPNKIKLALRKYKIIYLNAEIRTLAEVAECNISKSTVLFKQITKLKNNKIKSAQKYKGRDLCDLEGGQAVGLLAGLSLTLGGHKELYHLIGRRLWNDFLSKENQQ